MIPLQVEIAEHQCLRIIRTSTLLIITLKKKLYNFEVYVPVLVCLLGKSQRQAYIGAAMRSNFNGPTFALGKFVMLFVSYIIIVLES